MGISIPGKDGLYIERGPWFLLFSLFSFSPYYPMIILNLVILFFSDSAWLDPWFCCDSGWTRCSLFVWREPEKSSFNWVPGVFAWLVHSHWLECSLRVLHVLDVATRVIIYLTHLPLDKLNHSLTPLGQNGRHFVDDILKCIFMYEKFCI